MTKETGALDIQTSDVLLVLTEKAVMQKLLKPRHIHLCRFKISSDLDITFMHLS